MAPPSTDAHASTPAPRRSGLDASSQPRLATRVLAGLFAGTAALALVTVALARPVGWREPAELLLVALCCAVAAWLLWQDGTVPRRYLPAVLALGTTAVGGLAYFASASPTPLMLCFGWVFLYGACFLTTRELLVQLAYGTATLSALLLARAPAGGAAQWLLVGLCAPVAAAGVIAMLRARVQQVIAGLYDAARIDPLTQLANARGFRELLDAELDRARRCETDLSVVVGELDRLAEVGERSGQDVADAALRRVARLLRRGGRTMDGVARVGGERFALVLPSAEEHSAFLVAERLRSELREEFARDAVPLTISFGVACYPLQGETAAALLRAADAALYAARGSGGDLTVLFSPALRRSAPVDRGARDIGGERFLAAALDLAETLDLRHSGSSRHSETVGRYAEMIARELGLGRQEIARVRLAGVLHDVGLVGVPDGVLRKPGKLTAEELELVRRHPLLGAQVLEHPSLDDVRAWVLAHHERPDGDGYPHRISGEEIPLQARILAVADAYEAMTSERPYRAPLTPAGARAELQRCAPEQFDPRVVAALLALLARESERAETALGLL